ncbi:zinc-binding protein A33-like [Alligator mississippiensis]|uniref:Zinc-binding protein A33-like n=2 Tax=Alligator mississippiensis TaxID=8496 RepID=A0A151M651_ALLMI|nr:zinc-binding protein A33-like [Alligator mississippiensis]
MASALEVSSFTEDLVCPVCLDLFKNPRMLPCGHSFCAPCLKACIPTGQHQGLCPKCRVPFKPQHLAANWALRSLADKARLLKLDEGLPTGAGASWCFCTEHEEPLKLFCSQDEAPICVICRDLPQHRGHDFLPIKNAVQEYQEKLKACLGTLESNLTSTTEKQEHQEENKVKLEVCVQDLLDHISMGFEGLHQVLREKEQNMKETVKTMKEANLAEMEESLKDLREDVEFCNETLARTRAALEGTDPITFLSGIKDLMER